MCVCECVCVCVCVCVEGTRFHIPTVRLHWALLDLGAGASQEHQDAPGAGQGLFVACEEVSENALGGAGDFHMQTCPHTPGHVAPPEGVGCCVG